MSKMYRVVVLIAAFSLIPISVHASHTESNQPSSEEDCKKGGWRNYEHAGFRNQGDCIRFVRTGKFKCNDELGCVAYDEGDPLRLATALVTSGPVAFLGIDELRGVELAVASRGPVLGHLMELRSEDSGCSPEGGELAATAIAADPTIAAVIGTSCSGAALEAAPILSDAGYSMVSPSNTSPLLTDPEAHVPGYLRVAWNDREQAAAMAMYVAGEGATTSAVVVDGDPYSVALGEAFEEAFEDLSGTNLAFETAEPDGSDVAVVIAAVVGAGIPDVLYLPVFDPLGSALVAEARATPALDGTQLAASDSLASQDFVDGLGADAEGMLFTVPDPSFTDTPEFTDFASEYFEEFGEDPLTFLSAFAFDATNVIANAIEGVGVIDGDNTLHIGRQALRDALFATAGFDGLTGTITCNSLGDCGEIGFAILTVVAGELIPMP
jgi:branched-chain amino acid transport system substrate-binding protein